MKKLYMNKISNFLKKRCLLTMMIIVAMACSAFAQVSKVAIIGYESGTMTSFLNGNGFSATNFFSVPDATTLDDYDAVILLRVTGNSTLSSWVTNGGMLITEWSAANWALNTAGLLNASAPSGTGLGTQPITFANTTLGNQLGTNLPNPYSEGGQTEFFYTINSIGSGVEVIATRPSNEPAIIGGTSGLGYTFIIGYDWGDGFSSSSSLTGTLLLNTLNSDVINFHPKAPTAGNINTTYDGLVHTGTATPPSGSSVVWYDAATGGNITVAPSVINVGSQTAWAESVNSSTGLKSSTRTQVTATVTKAPLTVTADAKTKCYDAAVYSGYTVTYSGFVNGEDQAVLGGALTFNGTAINAVNPDTYSIVPTGLTSDNYNITFVNGTLIINPLPEPVISGPSSICAGSTTAVYTTVASMSQYVWSVSDGGTITSGAGTREITVSWTLAGEQRVLVTATNANGCSATDIKMVDVTALPTATLDEDVVICAGSSHTVSVALTGNAPWSISYTDGSFSKTVNGILKSPYTFTASPEVNTTKTYTVINVSDVNGCSNTGSGQAVITALPGIDTNPVVSAGQTVCFNSAPAELSATPAHGGSGVFTYQWQKKTTDTWTNVGTDALSYQPEALTTTTWFRLSATDKEGLSCGAVLSNEIAITVKSITSPGTLSADQLLAPGAKPATIMSMTAGSGDGAITYFWESSADKGLSWETIPGATSPDYAPATPNQPTWYRRVTVSTENSVVCTAATDPVKINLWATGIENPENGLGILSAYAVRNTEICLKGEVSKQAVATLYDIQGRVVVVKNLEEGSLNTIPTPYIKTGVYLLFVNDNQRIHKFKIPVKE